MLGLVTKLFGSAAGGGASMWGIIIVVVAVGGYIGVLKFENWSLENQVATLENDKRELQLDVEREKGNVRTCQARVDGANERLEDLKSTNDERNKIIDMLGENIDTFRDASSARIDNIRDAEVGEGCTAAMDFLREGLRDLR